MMRMKRIAMLKQMLMVFAAAMLSIGVAAAADIPAAKGPCADDVAKYCKDIKPGDGRIARCLKENEKQLSPACKSSIEEFKKKAKDAHQACEADAQKFCKDVKPGQGRIVKCLMAHEKDLSPECKAKMTEAKKDRKGRPPEKQ
jgi:Cysteine rich repeat